MAVWRQGRTSRPALRLYGTQLLFFGLHRPGWAVAAIAALGCDRRDDGGVPPALTCALWLMAPCLAWVSFAAALSLTIWRRNR